MSIKYSPLGWGSSVLYPNSRGGYGILKELYTFDFIGQYLIVLYLRIPYPIKVKGIIPP